MKHLHTHWGIGIVLFLLILPVSVKAEQLNSATTHSSVRGPRLIAQRLQNEDEMRRQEESRHQREQNDEEVRRAEESRRQTEQEEASQQRDRETKPRPEKREPQPEVHRPQEEIDLALMELRISKPEPRVGGTITAFARIRNNGRSPARNVFVVFFLNDRPVGEAFVHVGPRGTAIARAVINLDTEGPHHLHVAVDHDNGIQEFNEGNNVGELSFHAASTQEIPDHRKKELKARTPKQKQMAAGNNEIYVGYPNAGAKLYVGDGSAIQWLIQGQMDNKVKIQRWYHDPTGALKAGNAIAQSTANDGKYSWIIPNIPQGTYTIEVTTLDGKVTGESAKFSILYKKQPTVQILSPKPGTTLNEGQKFPIQWVISGQHNPKSNASAKITHQSSGQVFTIGLTKTTPGMPSIAGPVFKWTVGSDLSGGTGIPGGKYTLEIANLDNGVLGKSGLFNLMPMPMVKGGPDPKSTSAMEKTIPPELASQMKKVGTYKVDVAIQKAAFFGNYFYIDVINLGPEIIPKHLVSKIGFIVDFDKLYHCEFKMGKAVFDFKPKDIVSGGGAHFSAKNCPAGWYPSGIKFKQAKVQMILPEAIIDSNTANNQFVAPYPKKSPWVK